MNTDTRIAEIDDEIRLRELLSQLRNGWHWLVGGSAVGLIGAMGYMFSTPTLYEARAIIQPATIGVIVATATPTAPTTAMTATTVEPVSQTVERLNLATYYTDDIVKGCGVDSGKILANSVKANSVKGTNLLSISYRAESATLAKTCMNLIVGQLAKSQSAIGAPLIKELEDQKTSTKQQIEDIERFLAAGDKRIAQSPASNELSILMILKREDLMKLQKLYREQRIQLTEPLTQPIKLLEPIYVPENPVSPKKLIAVAGGLIGGVFVGLLGLLFYRGWCGYKSMSA